jgi:hypothetical protein
LSRHRKIQCGRSKAVALIAVGAFTVATAATAAAATSPAAPSGSSGPAAGRAHEADAGSLLTVTGQTLQMQAFEQSTSRQALQAYQLRDQAAELSAAHWNTARTQAARKLAAKEAATAPATQNTATQNTATQNTATQNTATQNTATQNTATPQSTASAQPTPSATASAAPVASGSPQQIARAMLASFGWSSSQFSCLDPLWAHESGWSVTAYNAGSGAYGIPQALPGSRMASAGPDWQTNAATQIRWGLEYIKGTYGSPCGAWDHEQATGWY